MIGAVLAFLGRHWKKTTIALGLAAFAIYRWWARRQVAAADRRTARAELERDVEAGRAAVAEAQAREDNDHAERTDAAHRIDLEIDHAAPATLDPVARRAALRAWLRARLPPGPAAR